MQDVLGRCRREPGRQAQFGQHLAFTDVQRLQALQAGPVLDAGSAEHAIAGGRSDAVRAFGPQARQVERGRPGAVAAGHPTLTVHLRLFAAAAGGRIGEFSICLRREAEPQIDRAVGEYQRPRPHHVLQQQRLGLLQRQGERGAHHFQIDDTGQDHLLGHVMVGQKELAPAETDAVGLFPKRRDVLVQQRMQPLNLRHTDTADRIREPVANPGKRIRRQVQLARLAGRIEQLPFDRRAMRPEFADLCQLAVGDPLPEQASVSVIVGQQAHQPAPLA